MKLDEKTLNQINSRLIKDEKTGCLIWAGALHYFGWPYIHINNKTYYVHRILWEHHNGPIDKKQAVVAKCKNRNCVNLDHLKLKMWRK